MPVLRKVEAPAAKKTEQSERKRIAQEYDEMLFSANALDHIEIDLAPDDNKITVKNRLEAAAKRRGMWIKWGRGKVDMLKFQLRAEEQDQYEPETETDS